MRKKSDKGKKNVRKIRDKKIIDEEISNKGKKKMGKCDKKDK